MKTLIILAGLPASGKSYLARIIKNKLPSCLYFDSDLFAKNYLEGRDVSDPKVRLGCHSAKLVTINEKFEEYEYVLLDTCFDMPASRAMIYDFVKENNIKLIIIEVKCSLQTAKSRIFENEHEDRMPGTVESRWQGYQHMRKNWRNIRKVDLVVNSDEDVEKQINPFLERLNK